MIDNLETGFRDLFGDLGVPDKLETLSRDLVVAALELGVAGSTCYAINNSRRDIMAVDDISLLEEMAAAGSFRIRFEKNSEKIDYTITKEVWPEVFEAARLFLDATGPQNELDVNQVESRRALETNTQDVYVQSSPIPTAGPIIQSSTQTPDPLWAKNYLDNLEPIMKSAGYNLNREARKSSDKVYQATISGAYKSNYVNIIVNEPEEVTLFLEYDSSKVSTK